MDEERGKWIEPASGMLREAVVASSLALLISLADVPAEATLEEWTSADLGPIFRHQLKSRLIVDLQGLGDTSGPQTETLSLASQVHPLGNGDAATFEEVFRHPSPPLGLLLLIKRFAKRSKCDFTLPGDVCTALYYCSIIIASGRCGTSLTSLGNDTLREGCDWLRDRPWVDNWLKDLLEKDIRKIQEP